MKTTIKERLSIDHFFLAVAVLIQIPLALNTGYFNHDELQWLALADTDSISQVPWDSWTDFSVFQYRPLTFNLWLFLSHFFGYKPVLMHTIQSVFAITNALLLRRCVMTFGACRLHASIAALGFLLVPFVVFTHSWIGTFADQLYLAWLLLALLCLCRQPPADKESRQRYLTPALVAGLTVLAVFSKESAVVFPFLLLCAIYRVPIRDLLPSLVASSIVVAIYLALRLDIILFSPRAPGVYTWAIGNIPVRLAEYSMFPFLQNLNEIVAFPWWDKHQLVIAAIGALLLLITMASAGVRWLFALAIVWGVALGPVLILSTGSNLYAYTASAFVCALFALAYPHIKPWSKGLLVVACIVALLHSVELASHMRRVGRMQHHLYADLMPLLPNASEAEPLRIRAKNAADESILHHLLFAIPTYHRMPFSSRIEVVASSDSTIRPTHLMLRDGTLVPGMEIQSH